MRTRARDGDDAAPDEELDDPVGVDESSVRAQLGDVDEFDAVVPGANEDPGPLDSIGEAGIRGAARAGGGGGGGGTDTKDGAVLKPTRVSSWLDSDSYGKFIGITTFFNPGRHQNKVDNFRQFRASVAAQGLQSSVWSSSSERRRLSN